MKSIIRGRDPISQLYRAVERYVKANNGNVLVIGGVQVQQWPGTTGAQYVIGVKCLGTKPTPGGKP